MRNVTVSVDDDTYRRSRIRAAELDTSVSELVRTYLRGLAGECGPAPATTAGATESGMELRRRELDEVLADFDTRGVGLSSRGNLTRDELYDGATSRPDALR